MATTTQSLLWVFLMALEIPLTVPPVPAPAIRASTFIEDGREVELGVASIAAMISGPVVSSCARGLFTCKNNQKYEDHEYMICYLRSDTDPR
jgi:hypothetical protein